MPQNPNDEPVVVLCDRIRAAKAAQPQSSKKARGKRHPPANEIDWQAVQAVQWQSCKEGKQAEFLVEHSFPWQLVERIGVHSRATYQQVMEALPAGGHRPPVEIKTDWYYG